MPLAEQLKDRCRLADKKKSAKHFVHSFEGKELKRHWAALQIGTMLRRSNETLPHVKCTKRMQELVSYEGDKDKLLSLSN